MGDSATLGERLNCIARDVQVALSDQQIDQLQTYLVLLQRWNRTINLTALDVERFPPPTLDRLIREPLEASNLVGGQAKGAWYDLGTGGGSPAIPLKIVLPGLALTMVESRSRKAAFLREVARETSIESAAVLVDRIENLRTPPHSGSADLVSLRAVKLDPEMASAVRKLLAVRGNILIFGGAGREVLGSTFCVAESNRSAVLVRSVPRETQS